MPMPFRRWALQTMNHRLRERTAQLFVHEGLEIVERRFLLGKHLVIEGVQGPDFEIVNASEDSADALFVGAPTLASLVQPDREEVHPVADARKHSELQVAAHLLLDILRQRALGFLQIFIRLGDRGTRLLACLTQNVDEDLLVASHPLRCPSVVQLLGLVLDVVRHLAAFVAVKLHQCVDPLPVPLLAETSCLLHDPLDHVLAVERLGILLRSGPELVVRARRQQLHQDFVRTTESANTPAEKQCVALALGHRAV
mmetsp:Transcript_88083/g.269510  ORF Transcript_88083/g.269510 Transcript_88083/m.269510 type:complete len:255 (+) Transcript_88083:1958-2722(+)